VLSALWFSLYCGDWRKRPKGCDCDGWRVMKFLIYLAFSLLSLKLCFFKIFPPKRMLICYNPVLWICLCGKVNLLYSKKYHSYLNLFVHSYLTYIVLITMFFSHLKLTL
jgi:hypothetical protein